MKKLFAYGFGLLAISALPRIAYAQFMLPNMQQDQALMPQPIYQAPPQPVQFNRQTFGNTTYIHMQGANGSSNNCTQMRFGDHITIHCQQADGLWTGAKTTMCVNSVRPAAAPRPFRAPTA